MEKAILGGVTVKPEVTRSTKDYRPDNSRDKHRAKENPERAAVLLKKPAAEPRGNGVAEEEAGQGPRGFIELHAKIGSDGPREREVHKKAAPRMVHSGKALGKAIRNFAERREVRVPTELDHKCQKHQKRHEEVQAVKFRDAPKHERNHRNAAVRVTELACKKETRKNIEDACSKGRRIDDGHEPLAVSHVLEGVGTSKVKHHNVDTSQQAEAVDGREIRTIRFLLRLFHGKAKIRNYSTKSKIRNLAAY